MRYFLLFLCLSGSARGQNSIVEAPPVIVSQTKSNLPLMPIGVDDLLQVSVYQSPELSGSFRVDSRGQVSLPMLKRPISAQGLYPKQVEADIADGLRKEEFIVEPVVSVSVIEYQSRSVVVTGAVRNPTTLQAYGKVTLLDALTRAQGLAPTAGDEVLVTRSGDKGANGAIVLRISIRELMSGNNPELNITLKGGEEIRVVEQGKISVAGNVHKPGVYSIRSGQETTILGVLAEAEGLSPYASKRAYIYRSENDGSDKQELTVEIAKIMDRKSPDLKLHAGDLLYIPDDHARRLTIGTLDKIFVAGTGAGTALVYAGTR